MNVKELIEKLQEFEDPAMEVKFAYDYGDHWHNHVAPDIRNVEMGEVIYSEYHRMDKVVSDGEAEKQITREVILIS